jgi:hypothetical protein
MQCGGTKTEIVIATDDGIQARAVGGTGNMAKVRAAVLDGGNSADSYKVGLQKSYET